VSFEDQFHEKQIADLPSEEIEVLKNTALGSGFTSIVDYLLSLHKKETAKLGSRNPISQPPDAGSQNFPDVKYSTEMGKIYHGDSSVLMTEVLEANSIDLIMTSPPFGLVKKKDYGNQDADEYIDWFRKFAEGFKRVLKPEGSLVIDIGGAWIQGQPTRSLYHFELLIMLVKEFGFHLAQEFYWWNPSKLPTPAEWVTIRRIRVKDAVNCIWWLSPTPYPKDTNRRVLQPYSGSMQKLLRDGYKPKLRPSGHDISDKFQRNNQGAIPPNLIALANTESNSHYQRFCRERDLPVHPARFPVKLPGFFIRMLTDVNDVVLDPFAGSCVTGEAAEKMDRHWICCEIEEPYIAGSIARFAGNGSDLFGMQKKPYEIQGPTLTLLEEEDAPFPEDRGRSRPSSGH